MMAAVTSSNELAKDDPPTRRRTRRSHQLAVPKCARDERERGEGGTPERRQKV